MAKRKYVPVKRELTAEQKARRETTLAWADENRDKILARGRQLRSTADAQRVSLREAFRLLKAERERQGMSLNDLEAKTGINKPALSRLENAEENNSTVSTLCRIAEALGKSITIQLVDQK